VSLRKGLEGKEGENAPAMKIKLISSHVRHSHPFMIHHN